MVLRRVLVVAAAACVVGTTGVATAQADPQDGFTYTSEAGAHAFVGSAAWGADQLSGWEYDGAVKVDADGGWDWARLELSAPAGQQLHEGTYTGARFRGQTEPQLTTAGFAAFRGTQADGTQACDDVAGDATADFTVTDLARAADGTLTDLDTTFVLHCSGPAGPATTGEVHFHR
ncbi:hypothetical protein QRX50_03445 [Amycolatopsis carbonis]|uniref:Uncharacterized protein n=1 Tax=Amycolatopsis carbonis TaxID=715471 RepID=A0A9Y2MYA5_9PSEU|nr:hypothetical protein [Amycolatopsis sp. 2-15]WIX79869.1 hypothetical protein QRX50_03445 [Amycolatopsis sp. 2-15]